jgi:hypothetical protein
VKDEWHCWSWFPKEWCCGSYGPNGVCIHWWAVSSPFAGVGGFMAFNQRRGAGSTAKAADWRRRTLARFAASLMRHVSLASLPPPQQPPVTSPYCFLSTNDSRLPVVVFANAEANESVKDDLRARAFLYTLVRPETYLAVS